MGEEADYLNSIIDGLGAFDLFDDTGIDLNYSFDNDIWTTKDGTQCSIRDMELRHLLNCLGHIRSSGDHCAYGYGGRWVAKLQNEVARRRNIRG